MRTLQGQVARDVDVGCADLVARRQIGQSQRYFHVVRHQVQHPRIKAAHGMAEQAAQV